MHRNRKRESLHGGVVAKSLLACLYFAAVGMGYVWNKNQVYRLGDEIKRREAELASIEKRNTVLAAQLAHLKSPAQLEARNQEYQLGLQPPRQGQVIRVYEPGAEWDALARRAPAPHASPESVVARR